MEILPTKDFYCKPSLEGLADKANKAPSPHG